MEVLVALLAFAGALLAGITTGVLVRRLRDEPAGWLIAWSIATGALAVSLGAVAVGHLTGFGPVTFRAYQITGSLLAPLWLAVGVLQLLAEKAAARFAGWLLGAALTVVGTVIMVLDPIVVSGFAKALPDGPTHWDLWPEWLLRGVHGLVVFLLLLALGIALMSWRDGDDYDADNMNATVVLAPAGMAVAGALEFGLPGLIVVPLMAAAAGGVWYAVARPLAPYDDEDEEDDAPEDEWQGPRGGRADAALRAESRVPSAPSGPAVAPGGPGARGAAVGAGAVPPGAAPRRSGLGDLVAEYRAGEQGEVDYAARMRPPGGHPDGRPDLRPDGRPLADDFGGPATGQLLAADQYGQPLRPDYAMPAGPAAAPDRAMPATGVVYPGAPAGATPVGGAELPSPADLAASFGVGFGRSRQGASPEGAQQAGRPARQGGSVKPSPGIYGLLTVFTLLDGSGEAFDKLAEETVEAVQRNEPDTLLFVCHAVKSAPLQRIVYELYRDEVGYGEHQRQPHMERFTTERVKYVLAANVIELAVNAAKVVPLPTRM
ncbi:putative quinol monooxygenase [Microbispora sp. NBC_01389]|uniref:putative quinol monooxygenase n=1 Tax=Microbispora sp. NBC_01389 TaxID=2903584 RepID=UPI003249B067